MQNRFGTVERGLLAASRIGLGLHVHVVPSEAKSEQPVKGSLRRALTRKLASGGSGNTAESQ